MHSTFSRQRRLPRQNQLHVAFKVQRVKGWLVPLHGLPVSIYQELHIVPFDGPISSSTPLAGHTDRLTRPQELIQGVRVWPIDLNFVENGELKAKLFVSPLPLLLARSRSLSTKLVAGKCQQIETILFVLIVQSPQSRIVDILQGSFARNVKDYQHTSTKLIQ